MIELSPREAEVLSYLTGRYGCRFARGEFICVPLREMERDLDLGAPRLSQLMGRLVHKGCIRRAWPGSYAVLKRIEDADVAQVDQPAARCGSLCGKKRNAPPSFHLIGARLHG